MNIEYTLYIAQMVCMIDFNLHEIYFLSYDWSYRFFCIIGLSIVIEETLTMPLLKKLLFGMGTLVAVMAVVTFVTTKPVVSLVVVVAVVAFVASRPKPAPFHVPVPPMEMKMGGYDIFLAFHFIMSILPDKTRKKYLVKKFAPKPNEQMDRFVFLPFPRNIEMKDTDRQADGLTKIWDHLSDMIAQRKIRIQFSKWFRGKCGKSSMIQA